MVDLPKPFFHQCVSFLRAREKQGTSHSISTTTVILLCRRTKATSVQCRIHPRIPTGTFSRTPYGSRDHPCRVIGNSGRGKVAYGASRPAATKPWESRWEILTRRCALSANGRWEGARISRGLDGKNGYRCGRAVTPTFLNWE